MRLAPFGHVAAHAFVADHRALGVVPRAPADGDPARRPARRAHLELHIAEGVVLCHAAVERNPAHLGRANQADLVKPPAQQRRVVQPWRQRLRRSRGQPAEAVLAVGFPEPVGRQLGQRLPAAFRLAQHRLHAAGQGIEGRRRTQPVLAQLAYRVAPAFGLQVVGKAAQGVAHAPTLPTQHMRRQQHGRHQQCETDQDLQRRGLRPVQPQGGKHGDGRQHQAGRQPSALQGGAAAGVHGSLPGVHADVARAWRAQAFAHSQRPCCSYRPVVCRPGCPRGPVAAGVSGADARSISVLCLQRIGSDPKAWRARVASSGAQAQARSRPVCGRRSLRPAAE